jgi:hypothetical protein
MTKKKNITCFTVTWTRAAPLSTVQNSIGKRSWPPQKAPGARARGLSALDSAVGSGQDVPNSTLL